MKFSRPRSSLAIGGLALAVLALGIAWGVSRNADANHVKAAKPAAAAVSSPVAVVGGVTVVEMSMASQRSDGVVVQPVATAPGAAATLSYGVVMNLQPLVEWRAKFTAATAQAKAARIQVVSTTADLTRTRALHDDDQNASLKSLQAAQAAAEEATANADAAEAALQGLRRQGDMQFSVAVIDAVAHGDQPALLSGRRALVRVAMAAGADSLATASIACGGPQLAAHWIAASPQADAQLGAAVQLFEVDRALPADASCTATVRSSATSAQGMQVPLEAVVWFADQPWVYVQRDDTHFARTALLQASELPHGFFVPQGLRGGQKIVTQGAGLLLSLEQQPPAGSASACKDPECDD